MKQIPVLTYSRVCGYFQPVREWNPGKKAEFKDRHQFTIKEIEASLDKTNKERNTIYS